MIGPAHLLLQLAVDFVAQRLQGDARCLGGQRLKHLVIVDAAIVIHLQAGTACQGGEQGSLE